MAQPIQLLQQASILDDVYKTLSPRPLLDKPSLDAFYVEELNEVRGGNVAARLELGLKRAHGALPYKALLMGHSGVGKSTELTRLAEKVNDRFSTIRFSVTEHLDPQSFKPFDVLLLMVAEAVERTARSVKNGGAGKTPDDDLARTVWDWFASEKELIERSTEIAAAASAGAGITADSWWGKLFGLFGSLKGEMKYASVRKDETVAYRLSRLDSLINAANRLFAECNRLLRNESGREWLFIGEDFDRMGVKPGTTEDFFITYGNVLKNLGAHVILTLPVTLGYSTKAVQLPVPSQMIFFLPDTTVFTQDHMPHRAGREAIRRVLAARVSPTLFAPGQLDRLVIASAGNLRELFGLVGRAADDALIRGAAEVAAMDAEGAIAALRTDYERRLGESPFDHEDGITFEDKLKRLVMVYQRVPEAEVPDNTHYSLLRSRAIQEFNGKRWYGVHPLVVDVLAKQGALQVGSSGVLPGGTR